MLLSVERIPSVDKGACVPLSTEGIRAGRTEVWDTAMEIAGVEI